MSWWQWVLVGGGSLFALVRIVIRFNPRMRRAALSATPVGAVLRMRDSGVPIADAIFEAISVLRYRAPWNELSESDLKYAAERIATVADAPLVMGSLISDAEIAKELGPFKDRVRLDLFIKQIATAQQEQSTGGKARTNGPSQTTPNSGSDPWAPADVSPILLQRFNAAIEADSDYLRSHLPPSQVRAAGFWFCIAPTMHFFGALADQSGRIMVVPVLQNASSLDGQACAALSQGYCAFTLYRMLSNSEEYRDAMRMNPQDVRSFLSRLPSEAGLRAFDYYRERFDIPFGEENAVDPRDWAIVWLWDIADVLIPDAKAQERALGEWNSNMFARLEFVELEMKRFATIRTAGAASVAGQL